MFNSSRGNADIREGSNDMLYSRLIIILIFLTSATVLGAEWDQTNYVKGAVIFKTQTQLECGFTDDGSISTGSSAIDGLLASLDAGRLERTFPDCRQAKPGGTDLTGIYTLQFAVDIPVDQVCEEMSRFEEVEYVQPWFIYSTFLEHNDPERDEQYFLDLIEANAAHDISTGNVRVGVAIVDMGMDMDHEDLAANLWYNPGEDRNGDRVIQNEEIDGRDSDGNGKADDFYGWDFVDDDNYPDDPGGHQAAGHGTHCAGIASAVTNNEVGISSIGYNCGIIPVRAGGAQGVQYGLQGITYAVDVGAKVISCSWGGFQDDPALEDVVEYAWDNDVIIIGAAGNMGMELAVYPGAYEHAVSVAATDDIDRLWMQSCYGRWVNVSAPGVDIFSTYLEDDYFVASGTSMATPLVAGLAGLIRASNPALTAEETFSLIEEGADPIDHLNHNFEGLLGTGRINAFNSLAMAGGASLTIEELAITSDDNNNGRMDAGESIELTLTVSVPEGAEPLENLVAVIECDDEFVTLEVGEVDLPRLEPGDSFSSDETPFVMEISGEATGHTIFITLTVTNDMIAIDRTFEMVIGIPAVLVVDDDDGQENQDWYLQAVEGMDLGWQRWETRFAGAPDQSVLTGHNLVIWETGNSSDPIDNDEWHQIDVAVQGGTSILLTGNRVGDDNRNRVFLRELFGAEHIADSVRADLVAGVQDSPIQEGVQVLLVDNDSPGNLSPSTMDAVDGSRDLVHYIYNRQVVGVGGVFRVNEENRSRRVYLGFSLESVSDVLTTRDEIFCQLYNWFTGEGGINPPPGWFPDELTLEPVYPNPFNSSTLISYSTPCASNHVLRIIDLNGREVCGLTNGWIPPGRHQVVWKADNYPAGVYLAQISIPGTVKLHQKLVLMK